MTARSISNVFEDFIGAVKTDDVSVDFILDYFHERGFGFILFFLALPMALPVPVPPGINILLASPLLILTAQQAAGRRTIWMPQKIRMKTIGKRKMQDFVTGAVPWMTRLELLTKPRLGFITQGLSSNIIGILGFLMALTICIPLPLTNTVPSLGIALMAVGVIMRDGLAVIVGALVGCLWLTLLYGALIIYGPEGIDFLKETIKSFMS